MSKPDGAMAIGRNLYLFTAPTPSGECLITAHGGALSGHRTFMVPAGITLNFYAPHGYTLKDPGLALVYSKQPPTDVVSGPAQCHDYALSKYQGRHGNNAESYEDISTKVRDESMDLLNKRRRLANETNPVMRDMLQTQAASIKPFNVVTIRNRLGSGDVLLSDVIRQVRDVMPMIRTFHCSFCRSHMHVDAGLSARAGQY